MDYEKEYKDLVDALKSARNDKEKSGYTFKSVIDSILQELRESEDEKMKKRLVDAFHSIKEPFWNEIRVNDIITWLDKQGEQKPVELDAETRDIWEYIKEWKDKFGRLPKDEDELAACVYYVMQRQKPVEWSEEDEKMRSSTIFFLNEFREVYKDGAQKCIAWLKSLKPQTKYEEQKWSKQDEQYLQKAIECTFGNGYLSVSDWLKSLKPQPKQEWSEEDENIRDILVARLVRIQCTTATNSTSPNLSFAKEIEWLSNLRPQPHWKPSEEQIKVLEEVYSNLNPCERWNKNLKLLLDELKTLCDYE